MHVRSCNCIVHSVAGRAGEWVVATIIDIKTHEVAPLVKDRDFDVAWDGNNLSTLWLYVEYRFSPRADRDIELQRRKQQVFFVFV